MLKDQMQEALSKQVNAELFSSYLYLAMSAYFESLNLRGAANWMRVQAQEELVHVMKFYDFIHDRGGRVALLPVEGPPKDWASPLEAFKAAYAHECSISEKISGLVDLSLKLSDHATNNFLQWFVAEQVEEEASVDEVVQQLKLVGNDGQGLFMIDRELATRTFAMPTAGTTGAA